MFKSITHSINNPQNFLNTIIKKDFRYFLLNNYFKINNFFQKSIMFRIIFFYWNFDLKFDK